MAKTDKKSRVLTVVIAVVLAAWAVIAGVFIARSRLLSGPAPAAPAPAAKAEGWEEERWSGIYQEQTKIGYTVSRLRKDQDGFELWSQMRIKIKVMDTAQDINLSLQAKLGPDHTLREIYFELLSGVMEIKAQGKMEGPELLLTVDTGGEKIQHRLHFEKPPVVELTWELEERLKGARPGDQFGFAIFEPMTQTEMPIQVKVLAEEELEVGGKKVPCLKVDVAMSGQSEWAWVAKSDGRVVKEYAPISGFTTLLEDQATAMKVDWEKAGELDLLTTLMVKSSTALINPRGITYFKGRLTNASLQGLDLSLPGRQTISGSTVEVKMEAAIPAAGYALPIQDSLPEPAQEFSQWLAPTVFIQSDHPKIIAAAKEAAGDAKDAVTAVDRLLAWMNREVQPSMVASIPSALEVLEKKRGACKEHTVLFVALARALGLPCRSVSGIVYSDQQVIDGFYYHAWVEVYLAGPDGPGLWVTVDPTFNQNPADATHVRLKEGDLEEMIDLMQVVGALQVKVGEYH